MPNKITEPLERAGREPDWSGDVTVRLQLNQRARIGIFVQL